VLEQATGTLAGRMETLNKNRYHWSEEHKIANSDRIIQPTMNA